MAQPTKVKQGEIGESGTYISGGVISNEEYNQALTGRRAIDIYERMRRSDSTVRQSLAAIKELINGADYGVDPASDDKKDAKIADFVDYCLFSEVDWPQVLSEILTQLDFGFSVFEMVFEPRVYDGQTRIALVKLGFRKQTTITAWEMEHGGAGITQRTADGKIHSIPLEKYVRFTIQQEGDNYEGVSLLRTSYKNWSMKDKLERIDVVAQEKHAVGVLDITYPKGTRDEDIRKARQAARNMRANEASYVDHPEGISMEFMDMKANSLRDVNPSINRHDRQILRNVLAQFLELGGSASGSRATSEDHSKLFEKAVGSVARNIVKVMNAVVVKTIIDLNFSDVDYPTMRVGKISDDDMQIMSTAIKLFVDAGILHPRPADENAIRNMSGLSEVPEDELEPLFKAKETETKTKTEPPTDDDVTPLEAAKKLSASLERQLYAGKTRAA